jgi:hypothetical protein
MALGNAVNHDDKGTAASPSTRDGSPDRGRLLVMLAGHRDVSPERQKPTTGANPAGHQQERNLPRQR